MPVVGQGPHQLVERQCPPLAARARRQAGAVDERRMRHRAQTFVEPIQIVGARSQGRAGLRQRVQTHQRIEVTVARPAEPDVGAAGGRGIRVIDDDQRSLVGGVEPEPLEQTGMARLGVLAPDDEELRAVADLAQRGRRGAPQRDRRRARPRAVEAVGRDQRTETVGEGERRPSVLHRGARKAVHEWTARRPQELARPCQRGVDLRGLTVDRRRRRPRRPAQALGEPVRAERTIRTQTHCVARVLDRHVVTQQTAAGTRERAELRHRSAPRRRAQPAIELLARSARVHRHRPTPACRPERRV